MCIYHLFVWSNLNFLHNSRWITFPTQSCLVLYSLCSNLLHLFILFIYLFILLVSSLPPHSLHLLFFCVLYVLALTFLLSHVHVFSCEISLVCLLKCPCNCFSSNYCFWLFLLSWSLCCLYCFCNQSFFWLFFCSLRIDASTLS